MASPPSRIPLLPGITCRMVATPRLAVCTRFAGTADGVPVLFIHGNNCSATFWEETMLALPAGFRGIAPDLRGFGDTEFPGPADATRGCLDWADDALALADALGLTKFHAVGHSFGGAVCYALLERAPERLLSVTLICPASPFGFGGSKDVAGTLYYPDGAGAGAGFTTAALAKAIDTQDRSDVPGSPRFAINNLYFKPPFRSPREEELLSGLLSARIEGHNDPADKLPSANWPFFAPGKHGAFNAMSALYMSRHARAIMQLKAGPPVLLVQGVDDVVITDRGGPMQFATHGRAGLIPGYPGEDVFPDQPMKAQTREVLRKYAGSSGARFEEVEIADCGHTPFVEKPEEFGAAFHGFLASV
ncbi:alpha/beta hydrolase fold-containing protein [Hyaloraphidium curvatum]|nr:alpha/beta hydrolase fold-containing protein [Hyaloraphidium curvatum]